MWHARLDLSRNRLDVCLLSDEGEILEEFKSPADVDGLGGLVRRVDRHREPVRAVVESWLPDPTIRRERELARFRLHLVKHRSMLKHRIHSTLINFGEPCPVTDLFGLAGRELLQRLDLVEPWRQTLDASLHLIDELDFQIAELGKELRSAGADHRYVPLLMTVPGIGWVLAYTIAAEIGGIQRFSSAKKLAGYSGLCPNFNPFADTPLGRSTATNALSSETRSARPLDAHGPTRECRSGASEHQDRRHEAGTATNHSVLLTRAGAGGLQGRRSSFSAIARTSARERAPAT